MVDEVANLQTWLDANRAEMLEGYVVAEQLYPIGLESKVSYHANLRRVENAAGSMERTEVAWMLANMGDSPVPHDVALRLNLDTVKAGAERQRERVKEVFVL